eukprot:jgi/Antlo1/527/668
MCFSSSIKSSAAWMRTKKGKKRGQRGTIGKEGQLMQEMQRPSGNEQSAHWEGGTVDAGNAET